MTQRIQIVGMNYLRHQRAEESTRLHCSTFISIEVIFRFIQVIYAKGLVAFKWPPSSLNTETRVGHWFYQKCSQRISSVNQPFLMARFLYDFIAAATVCMFMKFTVYTRWVCIGNREWKGWKNIVRWDIFSKMMSLEFWEGQVMEAFVFYY